MKCLVRVWAKNWIGIEPEHDLYVVFKNGVIEKILKTSIYEADPVKKLGFDPNDAVEMEVSMKQYRRLESGDHFQLSEKIAANLRKEPGWRSKRNPYVVRDSDGELHVRPGCPRWAVAAFVGDRCSDDWKAPSRGGLADGMSVREFQPLGLIDGLCVELEHTRDWRTALGIAMDHLVEDPCYYRKLARMETQPNPIEGLPGGSVSGCIKEVKKRRGKKKIDDPGAYCAAIADRIEPGWRQKNPSGFTTIRVIPAGWLFGRDLVETYFIFRGDRLVDQISGYRNEVVGRLLAKGYDPDATIEIEVRPDEYQRINRAVFQRSVARNPRVQRLARRLAKGETR